MLKREFQYGCRFNYYDCNDALFFKIIIIATAPPIETPIIVNMTGGLQEQVTANIGNDNHETMLKRNKEKAGVKVTYKLSEKGKKYLK